MICQYSDCFYNKILDKAGVSLYNNGSDFCKVVIILLTQDINSHDGFVYDLRLYFGVSYPQPHLHRSAELIHIVSGKVELTVNSSVFTVKEGESALVLPYRPHRFECEPGTVFTVHVFSRDCAPEFFRLLGNRSSPNPVFLSDTDSRSYYLHRFGADSAALLEISGTRLALGHTSDFCGHYEFSGKAPEISNGARLGMISALEGMLSGFLEKNDLNDRRDDTLVERVLAYVSEHCCEDLTLASAAAEIGYEPHYLCRCMKQSISLNFRSIVNSFRIEKAKELLGNTDIPITEVSQLCGFGTFRTFNRAFRVSLGMTPSEYRNG